MASDPAEGDETDVDRDVSRVLALTDGVVAIAITLLVLDLAVPDGLKGDDVAHQVRQALADQTANFLALIISFLVIGLFWAGHRRLFRGVDRVDGTLIWLNLAFLGGIALMPFTTKLIAEYGDVPLPTAIYAANVGFVALIMAIVNAYMAKLHDENVLAALIESGTLDAALVFFVSIPLAWLSPNGAKIFWAVLFVTGPISRRYLESRRSRGTADR